MRHLFEMLFSPPPMPPIHLPVPAHLAEGVMSTIREAYRLVYLRGVYDGFIGGVLTALLLAPRARCGRGQ